MIKLIATDMDGTLLDSNNKINPEFYEVFEKLKEKDIIFAAASGRQYYNLVDRFEDIKDNMMFIAENGTFVMHKGKEILLNSLDRRIALELIKIGQTIENAYVILCGKKAAYIDNTDKRFMEQVNKYYAKVKIVDDLSKVHDDILKVTICDFNGSENNSYKYFTDYNDKVQNKYYAKVKIVDDLSKVHDDILKVTICDFNGSENNSYKYFTDYNDKVQIAVAGEIWLDMMAKGVNKGLAISKLQKLLNIKHEETMVFGDYLNDLEMMQSAYHSYAMENAHSDLKKVARFMAKSNDDNGVVRTIKEKLEL